MKFAVAALAALIAAPASAVVVQITNISVGFSDAVVARPGNPAAAYGGNGSSMAFVYFGKNIGTGRSYYEFQVDNPGDITVNAGDDSVVFPIAEFTHHNFPVGAPSLLKTNLNLYAHVIVDGQLVGIDRFVYRFDHDETLNFPANNRCPYGGANRQGVNINGCADRVLVDFQSQSSTFKVGGVNYTLDLIGFVAPGTTDPKQTFLTEENENDDAEIVARIEPQAEALAGDIVPEPATWALFVAGFGVTGIAVRRRGVVRVAA